MSMATMVSSDARQGDHRIEFTSQEAEIFQILGAVAAQINAEHPEAEAVVPRIAGGWVRDKVGMCARSGSDSQVCWAEY